MSSPIDGKLGLGKASSFLFDLLYQSEILIPSTCIFDSRGQFKQWLVVVGSKSKKNNSKIGKRKSENINLLVLQSDWGRRAKIKEEKICCISQAPSNPGAMTYAEFKNFLRELGRQEAEIRSDIYNADGKLKHKGPFCLQQFIAPKNDSVYITDYSVQSSQRKKNTVPKIATTCDRISKFYKFTTPAENNLNQKHDLGYGIQSKLRNVTFRIVEYLHLRHGILVQSMRLQHVLEKDTDKLYLIGAEQIVYKHQTVVQPHTESFVKGALKQIRADKEVGKSGSKIPRLDIDKQKQEVTRLSLSESKFSTEEEDTKQKDIQQQTLLEGEEKIERKPCEQQLSCQDQDPIERNIEDDENHRPAFFPSSVFPRDLTPRELGKSKLWKSLDQSLENNKMEKEYKPDLFAFLDSDNVQAVSKKMKTKIIQHLQRKIHRAIDHLEFLVKRIWALEESAHEDEQRLRDYDIRIQQKEKEYENLEFEFQRYRELSNSKVQALEKTIESLANRCESYSQQLSNENVMRLKAEDAREEKIKEYSKLKRDYEDLKALWSSQEALDTRLMAKELKEMEEVAEKNRLAMQWHMNQKNFLRSKLTRCETELKDAIDFKKKCFTYLCDLSTPGVNPPPRKGGGYSMYPNPGSSNIKVVVKALVDGYFRERSVAKMMRQNSKTNKLTSTVKDIILKKKVWAVTSSNKTAKKSQTI